MRRRLGCQPGAAVGCEPYRVGGAAAAALAAGRRRPRRRILCAAGKGARGTEITQNTKRHCERGGCGSCIICVNALAAAQTANPVPLQGCCRPRARARTLNPIREITAGASFCQRMPAGRRGKRAGGVGRRRRLQVGTLARDTTVRSPECYTCMTEHTAAYFDGSASTCKYAWLDLKFKT